MADLPPRAPFQVWEDEELQPPLPAPRVHPHAPLYAVPLNRMLFADEQPPSDSESSSSSSDESGFVNDDDEDSYYGTDPLHPDDEDVQRDCRPVPRVRRVNSRGEDEGYEADEESSDSEEEADAPQPPPVYRRHRGPWCRVEDEGYAEE